VDLFEAALLGLVQGLTEFLPVSSSGHLVIVGTLLGINGDGILLEIAVHAATLLAVVLFYRRRLGELIRGTLSGDAGAWSYVGKLGVASIPAAAAGLLAGDFFSALFDEPWVAGLALLATGAILWSTRTTLPRADAVVPSWSQAFWIGCAQAVAIVPGISRSGATVASAVALGVAPLAAAEFSFLMSIPVIGGAALLQVGAVAGASSQETLALAVGGAVALVSGIFALWLFVRLLRGREFHRFAWYAWAVGTAFLLWLRVGA
jgi:undecaprenyl-diphosphatase